MRELFQVFLRIILRKKKKKKQKNKTRIGRISRPACVTDVLQILAGWRDGAKEIN